MELPGKIAVVTGGGRGIGAALCRRFAREGASVVVSDLDGDAAAAVADEVGGLAVAADVAQEADVQRLVAEAMAAHGRIDLFCSNAGIFTGGSVDVPDEAWQRTWQVNVMAHVYAARALLPHVLERGEGYLLATASAAGLLSNLGAAPYSVTKHAAVALAEWLSITYGSRGLTVSCLCPQGVRTDMLLSSGDAGAALLGAGAMEPDDLAEVVVEGLRSERFLILPHPEVATYEQHRAGDRDRWLRGMRRWQDQMLEAGLVDT